MEVVLNGIHANLRFSAAHIIPGHEFCGRLHGHSYIVDVKVKGKESGKFGFVIDFKDIKKIVRSICSKLDHKVLIPKNNDMMELEIKNDSVIFQIANKKYELPKEDCVLLDIKSTTAESLAKYFANLILKKIEEKNGYKISEIEVCVNEGIGQGAIFKKKVKK